MEETFSCEAVFHVGYPCGWTLSCPRNQKQVKSLSVWVSDYDEDVRVIELCWKRNPCRPVFSISALH